MRKLSLQGIKSSFIYFSDSFKLNKTTWYNQSIMLTILYTLYKDLLHNSRIQYWRKIRNLLFIVLTKLKWDFKLARADSHYFTQIVIRSSHLIARNLEHFISYTVIKVCKMSVWVQIQMKYDKLKFKVKITSSKDFIYDNSSLW